MLLLTEIPALFLITQLRDLLEVSFCLVSFLAVGSSINEAELSVVCVLLVSEKWSVTNVIENLYVISVSGNCHVIPVSKISLYSQPGGTDVLSQSLGTVVLSNSVRASALPLSVRIGLLIPVSAGASAFSSK